MSYFLIKYVKGNTMSPGIYTFSYNGSDEIKPGDRVKLAPHGHGIVQGTVDDNDPYLDKIGRDRIREIIGLENQEVWHG